MTFHAERADAPGTGVDHDFTASSTLTPVRHPSPTQTATPSSRTAPKARSLFFSVETTWWV
jgi:hypothetical protein